MLRLFSFHLVLDATIKRSFIIILGLIATRIEIWKIRIFRIED